MKNYIFLPIITALSIMTFTACGDSSDLNAETSAADTTAAEAATVSISETTSVTPETTAAEMISETTSETVPETTAPAETEKTEESESARPEPVLPSGTISIDIRSFYDEDAQYSTDVYIPDENNICVLYEFESTGNSNSHAEMRIFDSYSGEEKAHITLPESSVDNYYVRYGKAYGDDVLCMIYGCNYDKYSYEYDIDIETTVFKDYTFKTNDYHWMLYSLGRGMAAVGDHRIRTSSFGNIYDEDSDEIILNGIFDGYESKRNKRYSFEFAIDENRFLYSVWGYEWIWCIGIYDYTTGKAQDIPDTYDAVPIGVYKGKIYFYYCAHDGMTDNKLYTADINTLEITELYEFDEYYEYISDLIFLQDTGYFLTQSYSNDTTRTLRLNDLNSGDVVKEYKFENIYGYTYSPKLIGNRAVLIEASNGILYILNL
ncbi:MAG: hypothetical protein J1F11_06820 [Oscillospiraceae bacterium]|nr:hypothetical protein [Oscillospiraceae bacterium]